MNNLHVAIIMDGNGRWAEQRGESRIFGHREGAAALRRIVESCPSLGVRYLTVFAFSAENWKRSWEEINGLMALLESYFKKETQNLHKEGVQIKIIGQRDRLPVRIQNLIQEAEELTRHNTRMGLAMAISYGSQDEIVRAAQNLAQEVLDGTITVQDITRERFNQHLETHPWPDPDLLIRTAGELRLSNYLLWQLSYTELFFSSQYWPDFSITDFRQALEEFSRRSRRFGGLHAICP